ncbi:unnamed protein product [Didymodactylos carnosus]|uniref:Uncharacterized protein n=1 Tax=Didymodactylos carnosus TaxID=1234261 RepID=A0A8S2PY99_9BILA|nr:unnamed protein product [Didymodactylos carnosus]CAF4074728.1 unnamed protein product [Didymodactylos carnosus]
MEAFSTEYIRCFLLGCYMNNNNMLQYPWLQSPGLYLIQQAMPLTPQLKYIEQPHSITPREYIWRTSWPYVLTIILASLMALDTLAIFLLEIVSLSIDDSKSLSNTASTGAGIWGSIFFIIGVVMMFMLGINKLLLC